MKYKLLFALVFLFAQTTVHAVPLKPNACPTIASIKAAHFSVEPYMVDSTTVWWFDSSGYFGTPESWWVETIVWTEKPHDKNEALRIGNALIASLFFIGGPDLSIDSYGNVTWQCTYSGGIGAGTRG
jgi:hypothetical protein